MSFWFGDFELDQERRQLLRSGQAVPLEPKAYELLTLLVERRPRALSRAQIRDVVWPQTFVSESTLTTVVNGIRQALGDDARDPRFVRTVHGFGYAFCGEARKTAEGRPEPGEAVSECPYPGLLAFTEADAQHFFGREADVETLWERIPRQNLLAVIGPSGVGKTSFLRAGVIPGRPAGWGVGYATPGTSPAVALAGALVPDLADDAGAIGALLQGIHELAVTGESGQALSAVQVWRRKSDEALVVVDQFEELFALNTPEVQARFASFLGRLAEEAGIHVLLSLRDDFLFRCAEHQALRPVFHDLTPLTPPPPDALRRALVEPARREGYRFEDDALVEEMVASVEGVKGALPLLAFAVARVWEERDRKSKLLTRRAYERIGGVGGALAQHAEATLSALGPERDGLVREIFRNLVTAQGTRAAADRLELLSVFGENQDEAGAVLDALVSARLLTEYEPAEREGGAATMGHCRTEIVHESLLTHWPRLVRWQTQDADGAQLRDQLRQAAHLWEERGRPDDLLWSGSSYLDYRAWRARYPGGVSVLEGNFAQAMTALANRRRRRRRTAVAAIVCALAVGLAVVGVLWGRSEAARRRAAAEALRAEAGGLLALAQAEMERYPTGALAYATKSLELSDTEDARRLAVRVLQEAPTAFVARADQQDGLGAIFVSFDSTGEWLALGGDRKVQLRHRDGRAPVVAEGKYPGDGYAVVGFGAGPRGDVVVANQNGDVRFWSVPDGRQIGRLSADVPRSPAPAPEMFVVRPHGFFTWTAVGRGDAIRWIPLDGGEPRLVGTMDAAASFDVDRAGTQAAYARGRNIYLRSLENWSASPTLVATHPSDVTYVALRPGGRTLAAVDLSGGIRIWPTAGGSVRPLRVLEGGGTAVLRYSGTGSRLAAWNWAPNVVRVFDLDSPLSSELLQLRGSSELIGKVDFDPSERWLATGNYRELALWPLGESYPRTVGRHDWYVDNVVFTPDGSWVVSASGGWDNTLRAWSLSVEGADSERLLLNEEMSYPGLAVDSTSQRVAVTTRSGRVVVVPLGGGATRTFEGFSESSTLGGMFLAFSPDGRLLSAAPAAGKPEDRVIRVWNLRSGRTQVLGPIPGAGDGDAGGVSGLSFLDDEHLVASSRTGGVLLFDLRDGAHSALSSRPARAVAVARRARAAIAVLSDPDEVVSIGLDGQPPSRVFPCPRCTSVALDATEAVVATGSEEGIVRMGPASGGEPHLFFGRIGSEETGQRVAFSPDGRWVASSGERDHVRLWPVPDVTRTPLHKRSHEEVLATLRSWTNLRAVKDPPSPSGWKLEPGPFPGWARLPRR